MWLYTPTGFYSIIQSPAQTDTLLVRARIASDLDALRLQYLPDLGPTIETRDSDYRFRAVTDRESWIQGLTLIARDITYSNFKDRVHRTMGMDRTYYYHAVWSIMKRMQTDAHYQELGIKKIFFGGN
jgi:hypothetical protein